MAAIVVESVAEGCKRDFLCGWSKKGGGKDGSRILALGAARRVRVVGAVAAG